MLYLQLRNSALLWVTLLTPNSELRNDPEFILILSYNQWGKVTLEIGIYIVDERTVPEILNHMYKSIGVSTCITTLAV